MEMHKNRFCILNFQLSEKKMVNTGAYSSDKEVQGPSGIKKNGKFRKLTFQSFPLLFLWLTKCITDLGPSIVTSIMIICMICLSVSVHTSCKILCLFCLLCTRCDNNAKKVVKYLAKNMGQFHQHFKGTFLQIVLLKKDAKPKCK